MQFMLTKRFFISWLLSSLLMFLLSYVWHGIFLTDLSRLSYPKALFLFFAAIVYLMIGSFSTGSKLENMILDITWQLIEQGMGGLVVGIVRLLIFEPSIDLQED